MGKNESGAVAIHSFRGPRIRLPYGPRKRVAIESFEPTLTKQSFQNECDINHIMARYEKTGLVDHVRQVEGHYGNYIAAADYHGACNQVLAAQDMFMTLPAAVRSRFANDAGAFLMFVQDPKNRKEMADMGLLKPEVVQQMNSDSEKNPKTASSEDVKKG